MFILGEHEFEIKAESYCLYRDSVNTENANFR